MVVDGDAPHPSEDVRSVCWDRSNVIPAAAALSQQMLSSKAEGQRQLGHAWPPRRTTGRGAQKRLLGKSLRVRQGQPYRLLTETRIVDKIYAIS
jgi:hypothetical protein